MVAFYNGTSGNDVISGDQTVVGERDYINGGAGDDTLYGLEGNDTLTGDAGNDTLYGGNGNDGLFGGGGNDRMFGEAGDDSLTGNGGADLMDGGAGNDTFHYYVTDGADTIIGGEGVDTFRFWLPSTHLTEAMKADLVQLKAYIDSQAGASGGSIKLETVGVTLTGVEKAVMLLDGNEVPLDSLVNAAPVAEASVDVAGKEDEPVTGQLVATDPDGDALSWALKTGPANGSVVVNEDGTYTYTPAADWSGNDSFTVTVSDPAGETATQVVNVAVAAVADAPTLVTASAHVDTAVELIGGSGNDTLIGGNGGDMIVGEGGADSLTGDGASFTRQISLDVQAALVDTDGSEVLSVTISGVPADGVLSAGTANDDGSWTLTPDQLAGLTLSTAATEDFTLTVAATATESSGGSATTTDDLPVTFGDGTMTTFATLAVKFDAVGGNDTIDAGDGDDIVRAGAGDDILIDGSGNDLMYGEAGNDTFIAGSGTDLYDGGEGFDTVDYSATSKAVNVNLASSKPTGTGTDKLVSIEGVIGTESNDTIKGSKFDNLLDGGAGNDKISGGAGNDVVMGGDGNDTVDGGSGDDFVGGGDGNDKVIGGSGNDTLDGGDGNDTLSGGSGNDVIYDGAGNDSVNGGSGNDLLMAGAGNDSYVGGSGYDTLDFSLADGAVDIDISKKSATGFGDDKFSSIEKFVGSSFGDIFKGSSKIDTIDGGAGNDTIRSMEGADMLTGGAGDDTFVWFKKDVVNGNKHLGVDTITDFQIGDVLDLHDFLKSAKYGTLDDVVRLTDNADGTTVSVLNGKDFVDVVKLNGFHEDSAADMLDQGMILV